MKCGGIRHALKINAIAEAANIPCIVGSMLESSIATAAGLHLVASEHNVIGCELVGPLYIKGDVAVGLEFEWALVKIPNEPGLGVVLRNSL